MKTVKIILPISKYTNRINKYLSKPIDDFALVNMITNIIALSKTDKMSLDINRMVIILLMDELIDIDIRADIVRELHYILQDFLEIVITRFLENKILILRKEGNEVFMYRNPLIDFKTFHLYKKINNLYIFKFKKMATPLLPNIY